MRRVAVLVATVLGIGRMPIAPATWASFATAVLLLAAVGAVPSLLDPLPLGVAIVVLAAVGVWASGEAERELGTDAKPIVIDEVVGMLVAVWGLDLAVERPGPILAVGFLLFRLFDIVKPWPIRSSQRLPGGWGVVIDDLLAGVATNLVLRGGVALGWLQGGTR